MAYEIRFYTNWYSKNNSGQIFIDELDGTDPSTYLKLMPDGVEINYSMNDWNDPIVKLNATLSLMNDYDDFYEIMPLLMNTEKQYKVRITNDDGTNLFEGFMDTANTNEKYRKKTPFKITASNYLSKLTNVNATIVDTIQQRSLIDIFLGSLELTGKEDNVRVNCTLHPETVANGAGQTCFNRVGIDTEVFWKNNIERENALNTITQILEPFDSYLYWYDGKWYLERYEDIFTKPQEYVEYAWDTSYGYTDAGTDVSTNDSSVNIQSLCFVEDYPTIGFIPGVNAIEVKHEGKPYKNLTVPPIYSIDLSTGLVASVMYPPVRTWQFSSGVLSWSYRDTYATVKNANIRAGWNDFDDDAAATRFKFTIDPSSATTLKIQWKFIPPDLIGSTPGYNFDYKLRWFVRDEPGGYYIMKDEGVGNWYRGSSSIPSAYQTIDVTDLSSDQVAGEVSVSINMADPSIGKTGDDTMIFGLGGSYYATKGNDPTTELLAEGFGDVFISATQSLQDNLTTGLANNGFLNKRTLEVKVYDIDNLNYRNGLFIGTDFDARTDYWTDDELAFYPITDRLIANKMQLFNRTRQKLTGTIRSTTHLRPMGLYYDSSQGYKQFILGSYKYTPTRDEYECEWLEYDNETITNITYI